MRLFGMLMTLNQRRPDAGGERPNRVRTAEAGAALVMMAAGLVFFMVMAFVVVGSASRSVDRSRAQAAADAAALAGAAGGREEAELLARANGAELVDFERSGNEVLVTVLVDGARAVARADRRLTLGP